MAQLFYSPIICEVVPTVPNVGLVWIAIGATVVVVAAVVFLGFLVVAVVVFLGFLRRIVVG